MAFLISSSIAPIDPSRKALSEAFPAPNIRCCPEIHDPKDLEIPLVGPPRKAAFEGLTGLKLAAVLRELADAPLSDPDFSPDKPLFRAWESGGNRRQEEYALLLGLRYHRYMPVERDRGH